jgi:hypothetical protein
MDYTDCSLFVARNAVSDEAIEAAFTDRAEQATKPLSHGRDRTGSGGKND